MKAPMSRALKKILADNDKTMQLYEHCFGKGKAPSILVNGKLVVVSRANYKGKQ